MNTYNISVNGVIVLEKIPEENLEQKKEQITDIIFMKSREPNLENIKDSINVSLNRWTIAINDL